MKPHPNLQYVGGYQQVVQQEFDWFPEFIKNNQPAKFKTFIKKGHAIHDISPIYYTNRPLNETNLFEDLRPQTISVTFKAF